jgi:hypothetical protein
MEEPTKQYLVNYLGQEPVFTPAPVDKFKYQRSDALAHLKGLMILAAQEGRGSETLQKIVDVIASIEEIDGD